MSDQPIVVRIVLANVEVPELIPKLKQVGVNHFKVRDGKWRQAINIHQEAEVDFVPGGVAIGRPYFTKPEVLFAYDDVLMIQYVEALHTKLNWQFCPNCVVNTGEEISLETSNDHPSSLKYFKCSVCGADWGHDTLYEGHLDVQA